MNGIAAGRQDARAGIPGARQAVALLHWLTRPWIFALCAIAVWLTWLAAPGIGSGTLALAPLGHWNLSDPSAPWTHDAGRGVFRYTGPAIDTTACTGISLGFELGTGGSTALEITWYQPRENRWTGVTALHPLARTWDDYDLSWHPGWSGELQDLTIRTQANITAVTLEARGPLAQLWRAWRGFAVPEFFDRGSVNFLRGAQLGSSGWTSVMAVTLAVFVVLKLIEALLAQQPLDWRALAAAALVASIVLDLRFTGDLFANARIDAARLPPLGQPNSVLYDKPEFAALVTAVNAAVPRDAVVLFVSDAENYVNKAQYVFFPRLVVKWGPPMPWMPQYVILLSARNIQYDPARRLLTLQRLGVGIPADLIAKVPGGGHIFAIPEVWEGKKIR